MVKLKSLRLASQFWTKPMNLKLSCTNLKMIMRLLIIRPMSLEEFAMKMEKTANTVLSKSTSTQLITPIRDTTLMFIPTNIIK